MFLINPIREENPSATSDDVLNEGYFVCSVVEQMFATHWFMVEVRFPMKGEYQSHKWTTLFIAKVDALLSLLGSTTAVEHKVYLVSPSHSSGHNRITLDVLTSIHKSASEPSYVYETGDGRRIIDLHCSDSEPPDMICIYRSSPIETNYDPLKPVVAATSV